MKEIIEKVIMYVYLMDENFKEMQIVVKKGTSDKWNKWLKTVRQFLQQHQLPEEGYDCEVLTGLLMASDYSEVKEAFESLYEVFFSSQKIVNQSKKIPFIWMLKVAIRFFRDLRQLDLCMQTLQDKLKESQRRPKLLKKFLAASKCYKQFENLHSYYLQAINGKTPIHTQRFQRCRVHCQPLYLLQGADEARCCVC